MTMKNRTQRKQQGFTLIELLIVIAIIGILAAVAVPQYQDYTRKAKLTELDAFAAKYKTEVSACYHSTGTLTGCDNGAKGVSATVAINNIASVTVKDGVIKVKSIAKLASDGNGAVTRTYTPTDSTSGISWASADTEE